MMNAPLRMAGVLGSLPHLNELWLLYFLSLKPGSEQKAYWLQYGAGVWQQYGAGILCLVPNRSFFCFVSGQGLSGAHLSKAAVGRVVDSSISLFAFVHAPPPQTAPSPAPTPWRCSAPLKSLAATLTPKPLSPTL